MQSLKGIFYTFVLMLYAMGAIGGFSYACSSWGIRDCRSSIGFCYPGISDYQGRMEEMERMLTRWVGQW